MKKRQYIKILFTIIASLTLILGHAQGKDTLIQMNETKGECGTEPAGPIKRYNNTQLDTARFSSGGPQYVFNVKTHFINNIIPADEQELKSLDLVGALNLYFNSANIFFKYKGYENIADSSYLNLTGSNIGDLTSNMSDNQIDIFIAETVNNTSAGVTWTWTYNTTGEISKKVIALRSDYLPVFETANPTLSDFKNYTVIHEVGHYLGLYHPHQRWKYSTDGSLVKVSDGVVDCDALEENLNNSQWNILGDFIQDTSPDRVKGQYGFNYYSNCTLSWGNYHDDSCGNSIDQSVFNPSMDNIMAYYHVCRVDFSPNQFDFMRAFIVDESNGGFLTNQLNTIASLYQPFKTEFVMFPNQEIEVSVSRNLVMGVPHHPTGYNLNYYQKGFDYVFYQCTSGGGYTVTDQVINSYHVHEVSESMLGAAFKMVQVDDTTCSECLPFPMRTASKVMGGYDMHFNESFTNYSTNQLDSLSIKNDNFIRDLPSGIHIIKVKFENGEIREKTILKTEN